MNMKKQLSLPSFGLGHKLPRSQCRSLLTQEGICLTLDPEFRFLEVAYPYVARRLLTDEDPALRERLFQVHTLPPIGLHLYLMYLVTCSEADRPSIIVSKSIAKPPGYPQIDTGLPRIHPAKPTSK